LLPSKCAVYALDISSPHIPDYRSDAPWGISRLSQKGKETDQNADDLKFTYKYDSKAGAGVDIYIIDSGINTDHVSVPALSANYHRLIARA
jgi:cerevisin